MPTLHRTVPEGRRAGAGQPDVKKTICSYACTAVDEHLPLLDRNAVLRPRHAVEPPNRRNVFIANAAPDEPECDFHRIPRTRGMVHSLKRSCATHLEPPEFSEPEPVAAGPRVLRIEVPNRRAGRHCQKRQTRLFCLSMGEQFQAYMAAGQQAEAEEWLITWSRRSRPCEARDCSGSLLETKKDIAVRPCQYSRALKLLLAQHRMQTRPQQAASMPRSKNSPRPAIGRQMGVDIWSPKLQRRRLPSRNRFHSVRDTIDSTLTTPGIGSYNNNMG